MTATNLVTAATTSAVTTAGTAAGTAVASNTPTATAPAPAKAGRPGRQGTSVRGAGAPAVRQGCGSGVS